MNSEKIFKPLAALILALVSVVIGAAPFNLHATVYAAESQAEYFYLDGERVSLDDERVLNAAAVQKPKALRTRAASGDAPNVSYIAGLDGGLSASPTCP
jgi:hypothetical protein